MMKPLVLIALLMAFFSANAHAHKLAKCGHKTRNTVVSTITLAGPRSDEGSTPVFYLANASPSNVMFFREADAVAMLKEMIGSEEKWLGEGKSDLKRGLLAELEKDLPLAEHTDLNKYALRVPLYRVVAAQLVMELLREGRASVAGWNYFDPHPTSIVAPTKKLTLYILEDAFAVDTAEFCTESRAPVYFYTCCIH